MDDQVKISCRVSASQPGLRLQISVDDRVWFDGDPGTGQTLAITIPDDAGEHRLVWQLSGKTRQHTRIDGEGRILEDVTVKVEDVAFDHVKLGHLMVTHAVYEHDTNGTGSTQQHKFYGTMGCNGTVTLAFNTPIYLWLLENM